MLRPDARAGPQPGAAAASASAAGRAAVTASEAAASQEEEEAWASELLAKVEAEGARVLKHLYEGEFEGGGCSNAGSSTELHTFAHFPGAAFVVAAHGCDGRPLCGLCLSDRSSSSRRPRLAGICPTPHKQHRR